MTHFLENIITETNRALVHIKHMLDLIFARMTMYTSSTHPSWVLPPQSQPLLFKNSLPLTIFILYIYIGNLEYDSLISTFLYSSKYF